MPRRVLQRNSSLQRTNGPCAFVLLDRPLLKGLHCSPIVVSEVKVPVVDGVNEIFGFTFSFCGFVEQLARALPLHHLLQDFKFKVQII